MKRWKFAFLIVVVVIGAWSMYCIVASAWSQQISIRSALSGFQETLLANTVNPNLRPAPYELADLKAQQRMADAADYLGELTLFQLLFGIFGSGALIFTLVLNYRQLKESQKQTRLAHRLGLTQLRAYVSIEEFKLDGSGVGQWSARSTVRNRGQTPALNVRVKMAVGEIQKGNNDIPWDETVFVNSVVHVSTIAADGRMGPGGNIIVNQQLLTQAALRQRRVHVCVSVEYDDVFGTSYRRRSSITFTGINLEQQAPTFEGNDETVTDCTGFALELQMSESFADRKLL